MLARRLRGAVLVVLGLILAGSGTAPPVVHLDGSHPASADTNHAAIVIDTGGRVKKFCLAFPEESISGAEALRRVDAQPVFASFGGRGEAVCSLCGTGCSSSKCFCDPQRFWAYHRAGPGGAPYSFSRAGASSTQVRDGDVEGWRWGAGEAPPPATVSEVCDVEEPPARTAAGAPRSTTTTQAAPVETTTTTGAAPTSAPVAPATTTSAEPSRSITEPPTRNGSDAVEAEAADTKGSDVPVDTAANDDVTASEPDVERSTGSPEGAASPARPGGSEGSGADLRTALVFVALLGGILAWRAKLRRLKLQQPNDVR